MLIAYSHYSIKLHIYRAYRAYNAIYALYTVRFVVRVCLDDHLACCEDREMGSVSSWSLYWAVGGLARAVEVPGQSMAHTHCTGNQC